jgi:transposase InsO family protein
MMDFALDGVKWWSLIILDGYSRTILAGAIAPTEASWAALMVLYTACLRYGAPQTLISDSGGAYISKECEAVCDRLEIDHKTIVSTQGASYISMIKFFVLDVLLSRVVAVSSDPAPDSAFALSFFGRPSGQLP